MPDTRDDPHQAEIALAELQRLHPLIEADAQPLLTLQGSLASRRSVGGTAPERVKEEIARHRQRLA